MTININGTTGISGVDGSASTPALQGSDTNTGISFGTDEVAINTAGTARATVDASGRLLVGTSTSVTSSVSQQSLLQVYSTSSSASSVQIGNYTNGTNPAGLHFDKSRGASVGTNTVLLSGDNIGSIKFNGADGTNLIRAASIDCAVDGTPGANDMPGRLVFSTTADGASSPTERMRIKNSGHIYFNSPDPLSAGSTGTVFFNTARKESYIAGTTTATHWAFGNNNGTIGSITTNASATAYNTSSDYRLKENVTAVTDGITRLQQLKPSRFNFIADPTKTVDGFLAHEVQTVVPEAITGEKDAVDADGNPEYQGIDQSKLVPLLTAALQEAITRIETLEAEVQVLKGGN